MSVKEIVLAGNPLLRIATETVDETWFTSNAAEELIETLFETMHAANGVGLAAPQIGVALRVLVYGFEKNTRYPEHASIPLSVMVNPEILAKSELKASLYEGCLSLPNIRGLVPRYDWIEVRFQDHEGHWFQRKIHGFEARIIQHEIDHLDSKLFPEAMTDLTTLGITSALREAKICP